MAPRTKYWFPVKISTEKIYDGVKCPPGKGFRERIRLF
jgi:hypothetical protein